MSGFIPNIVEKIIKSIGAGVIKQLDDEVGKILEFVEDDNYDKLVERLDEIAPNFVKVLKGELSAGVIAELAKRVTESSGADSISVVLKPPPPGFGPSLSFTYRNKQKDVAEES